MNKKISKLFLSIFFIATSFLVISGNNNPSGLQNAKYKEKLLEFDFFKNCYRDLDFQIEFSKEKDDFLVTITAPVFYGKNGKKQISLWWADCRLLPESELQNKEKYWRVIYPYQKLKDPAKMTEEELERVRGFSSSENRRASRGLPMFFYDFLYSAKSKVVIEEHIIRTTFLGKETKIHERIKDSLLKVEQKIYVAAKTNKEIQDFIENLKSADAYNWRIIEGTGGRKSFHSYGIAIDLLPKRLGGKEIFWSWARDKNPKTWMLTPLSARWMPPQKVIDFFEEEGFIWGGNWIIFDNMHFEYHPELLNKN
ncbi:M15 family metallopeptidase [Treponema pectinovorum]|uniref:M15 family metallopeptidase n=1 Tax=Treponema pectinovorum TaxID=164 RepID=UPI0011C80DEF|nr:M15 family metallopeptidase [Treponema pectinovorum]